MQLVRASLHANARVRERSRVLTGDRVVDDAIIEVLELVMRDFVDTWYSRISTHQDFPNETYETVRLAIGLISQQYPDFLKFHLIIVLITVFSQLICHQILYKIFPIIVIQQQN